MGNNLRLSKTKFRQYVQEWVKALRSGTYKQGKLALQTDDNSYCCLGVLCDLAIRNQWFPSAKMEWSLDGNVGYVFNKEYYEDDTHLPSPLESVFKIRFGKLDHSTSFWKTNAGYSLMDMNDEQDKTFDEIGDFIEVHMCDIRATGEVK